MSQLFKPHTLDEVQKSLADFMPNDCVFSNKNIPSTIQYKLLTGLSAELKRVEDTLIEWTCQFDPRTTTDFITNWERMVGIPDECFSGTGDLETRRKHVVAKFLAIGVTTEQDFIDIAAFLGFNITISHLPAVDFFPPYDVPFDLIIGAPQSRFVMIVIGDGLSGEVPPYDVPFTPGLETATILKCFLDKLKPANTYILYEDSVSIFRITEGGDFRITEGGDFRVLE